MATLWRNDRAVLYLHEANWRLENAVIVVTKYESNFISKRDSFHKVRCLLQMFG